MNGRGGRRMPTANVASTAAEASRDSTECLAGRVTGEDHPDRVGSTHTPCNPRRGPRGDAHLAEDMRDRFDLVDVDRGCRRGRVDGTNGRNVDERVDRGRWARLRRRRGRGRAGIFRCARRRCRKLFGGHPCRRIFVVRRPGSRGCDRCGRRRGGRRRLGHRRRGDRRGRRRLDRRHRQLRDRCRHAEVGRSRHGRDRLRDRRRVRRSLIRSRCLRRRRGVGRRNGRRSCLWCRRCSDAGLRRRRRNGFSRRIDTRRVGRSFGGRGDSGSIPRRGRSRRGRGFGRRGTGRRLRARIFRRRRLRGRSLGSGLGRCGWCGRVDGGGQRRRDGRRLGGGNGRGRRRLRRGGRSRREEAQGVDVALRIGRDPDAEVDVRLLELGRAARAHATDGRAFGDDRALQHADRAEMDERDRVAVVGVDRDRLAAAGNRPGKRDGSARGSDDVCPGRVGNVDSPMLAASVRVVTKRERLEHRSVCRPGPRARTGRPHERNRKSEQHQQAHSVHLRCCLN